MNEHTAVFSDVLRSEALNLYRKYIERMNASEIIQALAENRDTSLWRRALEIYGPERLQKLARFGNVSAIQAYVTLCA